MQRTMTNFIPMITKGGAIMTDFEECQNAFNSHPSIDHDDNCYTGFRACWQLRQGEIDAELQEAASYKYTCQQLQANLDAANVKLEKIYSVEPVADCWVDHSGGIFEIAPRNPVPEARGQIYRPLIIQPTRED